MYRVGCIFYTKIFISIQFTLMSIYHVPGILPEAEDVVMNKMVPVLKKLTA